MSKLVFGGIIYLLGLWMFLTSNSFFFTVISIILSLQGLNLVIHGFDTMRGERIYSTLQRGKQEKTRRMSELNSKVNSYIYELRLLFDGRNSLDILGAILACLCVHIAKADGQISEKEIKTIRNALNENFFDKINHNFISEAVSLTKSHLLDIGINKIYQSAEKVIYLFLELIQFLPGQKKDELVTLLFTIIYEVAISDSGYASPEKDFLFEALCSRFGIGPEYQEVIKRTASYKYNVRNHQQSGKIYTNENKLKDALKLFGLEANYTKEQLEKSWKKIAMTYHPDRFHNEGEDVYKMMNQKFLEAKEAYEILANNIKK